VQSASNQKEDLSPVHNRKLKPT